MVTDQESKAIYEYVLPNVFAYKMFMGLTEWPSFSILPLENSQLLHETEVYGVYAAHSYDLNRKIHTLKVWKDLYKSELNADYFLFHEFTHILDTEIYASNDKWQYAMIKCYTEYHAAQVELLKLLRAPSYNASITFSMGDSLKTITGIRTVMDYVATSHEAATDIIEKSGFPQNIETLATVLGMIFNHLGRLSICQLYATDYEQYKEMVDNAIVEKEFIGESYTSLRSLLNGFPNKIEIEKIGQLYLKMFIDKAKESNLH